MNARLSWLAARWTLASASEDLVEAHRAAGWLPPVACLLAARGLDRDAWTAPASLSDLHDPYAMAGMVDAVARLRRAADLGERVRILTDYDVDGTTSSLILQAVLRRVAPSVTLDYHIPDRFTEGYGFSVEAAEKAARDGVSLLITADIGVRDHAAVAAARAAGLDVLICDHHLPDGADVPKDAIVLCPPQDGCAYPNRALAACGVSLKLAQALLADDPMRDRWLASLLKLAAIGTVADLVSVATRENRAIVSLGLDALNRGPNHAGLAALLTLSGAELGAIDEVTIGYRIAPRINAAGRIAQATRVVDLLTASDPKVASSLAAELESLNGERREVQRQLVEAALAEPQIADDPFVVVAGPEERGWHRGVIGIVAARLKDELHRPVAVVSIQGDVAVGSVRSVPGVHAVEALACASERMFRFGGHPAAAGFSLPAAELPWLRERLRQWMDAHTTPSALVAVRTVDATVRVEDLDERLIGQLARLRPWGTGHPEPIWRLVLPGGVRARRFGVDGAHLGLMLPTGRSSTIDLVWWRGAAHFDEVTSGPVELLGKFDARTVRGRRVLQFEVIDGRRGAGEAS